jgi:MFS transporter, MHS family, shikimate and dehydroshikimate transport protein
MSDILHAAQLAASANERAQRPTMKIVLASAFGTVIEWYDFFIYGTAAALVFGKLFFPALDPLISTLAAFSVYAVGYLARPFGGIVFGHFGDRVGRRSMLVLSMLLMGGGTFLVGLLPTYEQIGVLAPLLLVSLRLVQALGLGGEWGGAVLLVAETAPPGRLRPFRQFCAAWQSDRPPGSNWGVCAGGAPA